MFSCQLNCLLESECVACVCTCETGFTLGRNASCIWGARGLHRTRPLSSEDGRGREAFFRAPRKRQLPTYLSFVPLVGHVGQYTFVLDSEPFRLLATGSRGPGRCPPVRGCVCGRLSRWRDVPRMPGEKPVAGLFRSETLGGGGPMAGQLGTFASHPRRQTLRRGRGPCPSPTTSGPTKLPRPGLHGSGPP